MDERQPLVFVLLPGMDGTGDLFEPLLRALPPGTNARVVRCPANEVLELPQLRALVDAAAAGDAPYVLVAESFSGLVAIEHAAARPGNLRGLVLCATFAACPVPWPLLWLRVLARPAVLRVRPPRWLVRTLLAGRDCPPALLDAWFAARGKADPAVIAHRCRQVFDADVRSSLPGIGVPVLYLAASADRLVGRRGLGQVARGVPDLTHVVLDAPHLVLQVRPAESAREILRFAASL